MSNHDDAISYEASRKYLAEKSTKRAWTVAIIFGLIALALAGVIVYILPLKKVEPYVIQVDKFTGMTHFISAIDEGTLEPNEAVDKYFASTYVKKRESYYYDFLQQDYVYVQLFSNNQVANEYREIYEGETARDKLLGDNSKVVVKIISVVLGQSTNVKTATIRFILTQKDAHTNRTKSEINKVVTLSYDYFPDTLETEKDRLTNPLAFKVLSYRVDNEVSE